MSIRIDIDERSDVRVTNADLEPRADDAIEFVVEGTVNLAETLLVDFEGATLRPAEIRLTTDEEAVTIDLEDEAALRIESADVGVELVDEGLSNLSDDVRSAPADVADRMSDAAGRISFTLEGTIEDVRAAKVDVVADEEPSIRSISFALDETLASDGGERADDVVAEVSVLGFSISVRRNGAIVVSGPVDSSGSSLL